MNRFEDHQNMIGLIPAAGKAKRLQPLPCSKEIFPVGFHRATWTSGFTHFLHRELLSASDPAHQTSQDKEENSELYAGDVIQADIIGGLHVKATVFPEGRCLDIGTPEDLLIAVRTANNNVENAS